MISGKIRNLVCSLGALFLVSALPISAGAAETEPAVGSYAWYWETQRSQAVTDPTSGADVATIEAPNPFCPSTTAGGLPEETKSCHPGRLPIEVVGGDYKEPDKISAVAFDLALVPIGSTVSNFEVSFLEAQDDQSKPINAEGKSLQACLVNEFFGDGEARQYKEVPRYECTKSDPVAKRKAVKVKTKDGKVERFQYTFDLTAYAKKWVAGAPVAAIMLSPAEPKESAPQSDTNWRVVLDGPAEEDGIITSLTFKAPPEDELDELDDLDDLDDDFEDTGSSDSFDTGSSDSFDSGDSDVPSSDTPVTDPATDPAAEDPLATDLADGTENTSSSTPGSGIPGYIWLALLGGMVGFFLFRSVVLESAAGIRPDGVLAQIRQINASKRGGAAIEPDQTSGLAARLAPLSGGLKRIGGAASSLTSKLPFRRKG